ncbi:MAG: type II restriction endonuclease [Bacteroidales bacterium]|nr:type II restriction endonuclease [Bacteroidales bacterium]MDY4175844.1 type II restriction endonuclease [Bacteroidales bacterium]
MSEVSNAAINGVLNSKVALCRFITGNDTGKTGSHQTGFYIPKCASALLFDTPGVKGENKEKTVRISWQDDFTTESCMKYYGQGSRNEYRITRFGKGFPFLHDEHVGDLIVIAKQDEENYKAYILSSDDDIESFMSFFGLSPEETNQLIDLGVTQLPDDRITALINEFISKHESFPTTDIMSNCAQECYNKAYGDTAVLRQPDKVLTGWVATEYKLFKSLENKLYSDKLTKPFTSVEEFLQTANAILNRRKSRAGKSLEHHLASVFSAHKLTYEAQAVTEYNKRPDFLFPNSECYHNFEFPAEDLTVLGVKTTCKDRWRQVLSEANRVEDKFLFTLQQGVSKNQLKEMSNARLTLVVPNVYKTYFPDEFRSSILDLESFIGIVKQRQERAAKHYTIN